MCCWSGKTPNPNGGTQVPVAEICTKARKAGVSVGIGMGPDADFALRVARLGVGWIQFGGDVGFMLRGVDSVYPEVRNRFEKAPAGG